MKDSFQAPTPPPPPHGPSLPPKNKSTHALKANWQMSELLSDIWKLYSFQQKNNTLSILTNIVVQRSYQVSNGNGQRDSINKLEGKVSTRRCCRIGWEIKLTSNIIRKWPFMEIANANTSLDFFLFFFKSTGFLYVQQIKGTSRLYNGHSPSCCTFPESILRATFFGIDFDQYLIRYLLIIKASKQMKLITLINMTKISIRNKICYFLLRMYNLFYSRRKSNVI